MKRSRPERPELLTLLLCIAWIAMMAGAITWGIYEHWQRADRALQKAQRAVDRCVDRCDSLNGRVSVILLETGECACSGVGSWQIDTSPSLTGK